MIHVFRLMKHKHNKKYTWENLQPSEPTLACYFNKFTSECNKLKVKVCILYWHTQREVRVNNWSTTMMNYYRLQLLPQLWHSQLNPMTSTGIILTWIFARCVVKWAELIPNQVNGLRLLYMSFSSSSSNIHTRSSILLPTNGILHGKIWKWFEHEEQ